MQDAQQLIQALTGEQTERVAAAAELRRYPGLYLTALKHGLRHPEPAVRHACYWVISAIEAPGILILLNRGLKDRNERVRHLAQKLLKQKRGPTAQTCEGWLGPEGALVANLS